MSKQQKAACHEAAESRSQMHDEPSARASSCAARIGVVLPEAPVQLPPQAARVLLRIIVEAHAELVKRQGEEKDFP